jgi:hypothetical protein
MPLSGGRGNGGATPLALSATGIRLAGQSSKGSAPVAAVLSPIGRENATTATT